MRLNLLIVYTELGKKLPINDCTQFGSRLGDCKFVRGNPPQKNDAWNKLWSPGIAVVYKRASWAN